MPFDVLLHPAAALALEAAFFLIAMAQTLHVSRLICWRVARPAASCRAFPRGLSSQ